MTTIKKLFAAVFMATLLTMNFSCSGGNKIDRYIANCEKFIEKWKDKTSGEDPLSENDKKEIKADILELGKAQLELKMDVDLLKEITPEQQAKIADLTMEMAFIGIKAQ